MDRWVESSLYSLALSFTFTIILSFFWLYCSSYYPSFSLFLSTISDLMSTSACLILSFLSVCTFICILLFPFPIPCRSRLLCLSIPFFSPFSFLNSSFSPPIPLLCYFLTISPHTHIQVLLSPTLLSSGLIQNTQMRGPIVAAAAAVAVAVAVAVVVVVVVEAEMRMV